MSNYKLKPGVKIGAIAAETDNDLEEVFVDSGYLAKISDTEDRHFILLGRTGAGKSALIRMIYKNQAIKSSVINPDDLSMQFLQNSRVLQAINSWGVNLDIFYKFLWRHVCILELIRARFSSKEDLPSSITSFFEGFAGLVNKKAKNQKELRESAVGYLKKYGDQYWIKTDTRIKSITEELESSIKNNATIAAELEGVPVSASLGTEEGIRSKQIVSKEVVERAQTIVNDFLIADLNRVLDLLAKEAFDDKQKRYFILIDDLDKNWMYDDRIYLGLLKSLLASVSELNRRIKSVKVIVSLRENLYFRILKSPNKHDPQKEKIEDETIHIKWSKEQLVDLVNKRLEKIFRSQYSKGAPTFEEILPPPRKQVGFTNAVDYVLIRSLMRPRDLIDFLNIYIEKSGYLKNLNWQSLRLAEAEYSKRRLDALVDEWKDSYFGLPNIFPMLKELGRKFSIQDITADHIDKILTGPLIDDCDWLTGLQNRYLGNLISIEDLSFDVLRVLYRVGIVGSIDRITSKVVYSFTQSTGDIFFGFDDTSTKLEINPTFFSALNISVE